MIIHKVEGGDTLEKISKKYNTSLTKIFEDNMLFSMSALCEGQELLIPRIWRSHIVRKGDNLNTISKKYKISVDKILQNNPFLFSDKSLNSGQSINLTYPKSEKRSICVSALCDTRLSRAALLSLLSYLTYISFSPLTVSGGKITEPRVNQTYKSLTKNSGVEEILTVKVLSPEKSLIPDIAEIILKGKYRIALLDTLSSYDSSPDFTKQLHRELLDRGIAVFIRQSGSPVLCDSVYSDSYHTQSECRRICMPLPYKAWAMSEGREKKLTLAEAMAIAAKRGVKINTDKNGSYYEYTDNTQSDIRVTMPSLSLWNNLLAEYEKNHISSVYIDGVDCFCPQLFLLLADRFNIIKAFSASKFAPLK